MSFFKEMLLVVWAIGLTVAGQTPAAPEACTTATQGRSYCKDCLTAVTCKIDTGAPTTDITCSGKNVCKIIEMSDGGSIPTCVPVSDQHKCVCSGNSVCDPFDKNTVLLCNDGAPEYSFACSTEMYCNNGQCETNLCSEYNIGSLVTVNPACTSYSLCTSADTWTDPQPCPTDTYFDVSAGRCSPLPPRPCTGAYGAYPDPINCSIYHVCIDGNSVAVTSCPSDNLYFDPQLNECQASPYKCAAVTECKTCNINNVNTRYPDPNDSTKYYLCRELTYYMYQYVHDKCPEDRVFDPASKQCIQTSTNAPGCETNTIQCTITCSTVNGPVL